MTLQRTLSDVLAYKNVNALPTFTEKDSLEPSYRRMLESQHKILGY